jgi:hypothetical protein
VTRKAARIDRLQARAERLRSEGTGRIERARELGNLIPMGQPILVGHHSEKRHRRDLARINGGYDRGFAALKAADACERRASTAESNRAISSDDPEALEKLRAKLATIETKRAQGVAINKAGRAKDPIAALTALGFKDPARILKAASETWDGKIVAAFELTNWSAEARRLKERITILEKREAAPETPPEEIGDVRIVEEDNRVQLRFPGKPSAAIRSSLKSHGFRWSPTAGAWQRMASPDAWYWARYVAGMTDDSEIPEPPYSDGGRDCPDGVDTEATEGDVGF